MEPVKIKSITIEFDDGRSTKLESYPFAEIVQERGLVTHYETFGGPSTIRPNGHRRLSIRAWGGCSSYDAFQGAETI